MPAEWNNENDCEEAASSEVANKAHDPLHHETKHERNEEQPFSTTRIKKWLVQLVIGSPSNSRQRTQRKLATILSLLLAIAITALVRMSKRHRARLKEKGASSSQDALWPVGMLLGFWKGPEYKRSPQESTMSLLWNAARDGIIQQALIGSSTIYFQTKRKNTLQWNRADLPANNNESIKSGLLEALSTGGCTDIQAIPESIWSKLATPVLAALPFVYLALLYRMMKNQFGGEDISSKLTNGTRKLWGEEEKDRTTFKDVAGLQSVVEDLSEVVSYLSNPSLYKAMGARPPRGVLLHGPPGSGKTLLARAVAGEAMCDSFTALSGSAFVEMYVGRGAARVRSLFAKARRDAIQQRKMRQTALWWSSLLGFTSATTASLQRPPCAILFIDELDAVAKSRSSDAVHGNDEREQTLNQLLTEMDGFDTGRSTTDKTGAEDVTLIVIGASNRVDVIDEAVLRRFDRQILVGYPNAEGRKDILLVHAKKIQCASTIDWEQLASSEYTDNFSGADLRNLVNEAALFAIRERSSFVDQSHLIHAARRISQMKTRTCKVGRMPATMFFSNMD